MPRFPKLMLPTLVALAVGPGLLLLFEATLTRIAGVLALFAFVALGVFMIATPEYLGEEVAEEDDR